MAKGCASLLFKEQNKDSNGNQILKNTSTLVPITAAKAGYKVGNSEGTISIFRYNAWNQLVESYAEDTRVVYKHMANGLRYSKTGPKGETVHIWDGSNIVAETMDGTVTGQYIRGIGLLANKQEDNYNYYLYNAHGDVVQLVDENGAVTREYDYDAFGVEKESEPLLDAEGNEIVDTNPFRYCAEYFDEETGSIYLRARYYDPVVGRFTQQDPIRAGLNWYTYANGNPILYIDPLGLDAQLDDYINKNYSGTATVTIVARQPAPNSKQVTNKNAYELIEAYNTGNYSDIDVGHAFIRIDDGAGNVQYIGFYASEFNYDENMFALLSTSGELRNDEDRNWNVAQVYALSNEQYDAIIDYINSYDSSEYNILSKNCATFAVGALDSANINHSIRKEPWVFLHNSNYDNQQYHEWAALTGDIVPENLITSSMLVTGYTPASIGQNIRNDSSYIVKNASGVHNDGIVHRKGRI